MRIAFVGLKKSFAQIPADYRDFFVHYHLEIPFYYAAEGGNHVTITNPDLSDGGGLVIPNAKGSVVCRTEEDFKRDKTPFDVVVHWRSWQQDLYRPEAINVLHCCDFGYSPEWKQQVLAAYASGKLYAILCYRSWHQRNMNREAGLPFERLLTDMTLGVDTEIYKPAPGKDPFQMLWSSDPGRGMNGAIMLAVKLFSFDRRFRLHVCYPDYVPQPSKINHPAIVWHGNIPNGPKLWDLFNTTGILPYTSTFSEPSSRAHRQAQAAGSLVLYPPAMGSPSELIHDDRTGIVAPIANWTAIILDAVKTDKWKTIGSAAREFAVEQNWKSQATNFNAYFEKLLGERR